jgi:hypothetical protein
MSATPLNRSDLAAGTQRKLVGKDFSNQYLLDIDGKGVTYENCSFFASVIERGYFHQAHFKQCNFRGARFINSVFRSATFEGCDFAYADFNHSLIPIPQLLANLPEQPNVRWELLHNLRANTRSVGDTRFDSELVWREIDTELEHWRAIGKHDSRYYEKYTRWDRIRAKLRRHRLLAERWVWGHGESLLRLAVATVVLLIIIATIATIARLPNLDNVTIGAVLRQWSDTLTLMSALFIDLPTVSATDVASSPVAATFAVLLRYISIGLAVPILYKYIARR